MMDRSVSK